MKTIIKDLVCPCEFDFSPRAQITVGLGDSETFRELSYDERHVYLHEVETLVGAAPKLLAAAEAARELLMRHAPGATVTILALDAAISQARGEL